MTDRLTRFTVVLFLAMIVGLSIAQTSGILLRNVAADPLGVKNVFLSNPSGAAPALQVGPGSQNMNAGSYTQFEVSVADVGPASVLLVSKGLPEHSIAFFTPENGRTDPNFSSIFTIVTSPIVPIGNYNITVVALIGGQESSANVNLQIVSAQMNSDLIVPTSSGLSVKVETDQSYYEPNGTVNIRGVVMDSTGNAVSDAELSIQIDGPSGSELTSLTRVTTDTAGVFQTYLTIPVSTSLGPYAVFAAASKAGYTSATAHTNFLIGPSSTSSIAILQVFSTDATNATAAVFSPGETVLIWVVLQNIGAPIRGVIWIQILDPRGASVSIQLQVSTLATNGVVKVAFGFSPAANSALGVYNTNALVSNKLISEGGTFLANANAQFVLGE